MVVVTGFFVRTDINVVLADEVLEALVQIFSVCDEFILSFGVLGDGNIIGGGSINVNGTALLVLLDHLVK